MPNLRRIYSKKRNVHMCLMWSIFDSAEQYSTFLSQKGVVLGAGNTVYLCRDPPITFSTMILLPFALLGSSTLHTLYAMILPLLFFAAKIFPPLSVGARLVSIWVWVLTTLPRLINLTWKCHLPVALMIFIYYVKILIFIVGFPTR
jgi:hypothetical protein